MRDSSLIYADNNPEGGILIRNSLFVNNTSESNSMNLITTNTLIENS